MKQLARMTILLIAVAAVALAQQAKDSSPIAVPDEATAVRIAEKALAKIYGKKRIQSEKPFSANLAHGLWHVTGTLYCKDEHGKVIIGACVGGVAMADIRQIDGRVVKTGHTQ
jgi:hypothetical protein